MDRIKTIVNTARSKARRQYRLLTASRRAFPDFIIIGTQKGGTTSLFGYACQHPQILYRSHKELDYFDGGNGHKVDVYTLGERWYLSHFPLRSELKPDKITGEASPRYLFDARVPERIARLVPKVKLVAILRNPVDRAISHYFHQRKRGREPLSLKEAMTAEESRTVELKRAGAYQDLNLPYYAYKYRGHYKEQLDRFFQYFDRSQILVLKSEDLFTDPHGILGQFFDFVGVDPKFEVPNLKPKNVGTRDPNIDPAVIEELTEYFRPHNQALYDLLGRDLGW